MGGQKRCSLIFILFERFCCWGYLWLGSVFWGWGVYVVVAIVEVVGVVGCWFVGVGGVVEDIGWRRLTCFKTILYSLRILLNMTIKLIITTKNTRLLLKLIRNLLIHNLIIQNLILLKPTILLLLITLIIRFTLLLF